MPGSGRDIAHALFRAQAQHLRVPQAGMPDTCVVCFGSTGHGYSLCRACSAHPRPARGVLADVVFPIAYAPYPGQFTQHLFNYKKPERAEQSRQFLFLLAMSYLTAHSGCIRHGHPAPLSYSVVPSTKNRAGAHPLHTMLEPVFGAMPFVPVTHLPERDAESPHAFSAQRFTAAPSAAGRHVLLVEDTWVSGGNAQSAAHALKQSGADFVTVIALGRWVKNPNSEFDAPMLRAAPWFPDAAACVRHVGT